MVLQCSIVCQVEHRSISQKGFGIITSGASIASLSFEEKAGCYPISNTSIQCNLLCAMKGLQGIPNMCNKPLTTDCFQMLRNGPRSVLQLFMSSAGILGSGKWGGGNASCDFWGTDYYRVPPPTTTFRGLRKWDLSGLCPFPPKKMTWREQMGGKTYHRLGGGVKTVFGEGLMVCFPLP